MDIQVSSNFERLLFELLDRDPAATAAAMRGFRAERPHGGAGRRLAPRRAACSTASAWTTPATEAEIRRLHAASGYLADPHTAIGIAAARALPCEHGVPTVAVATAHPAKFPDAMAAGDRHPPPSAAAPRRPI